MKKPILFFLIVSMLLPSLLAAQETKSEITVTADFASNYIWRGTKFGKGPAIQPGIKFAAGGFTLGAWGNYCISTEEALEADLYTSYSFGAVNVGLSKYYFPGSNFFTVDNHAFELNGGLAIGKFSLSANYILNEGAGAQGGDTYFEASFKSGNFGIFAGAGNGWYTPDTKFNLCNIGISAGKEIKITDSFAIPLTGSLILNPATEQLYLVAVFSL
jgi:uncharacterized protein (TIGR02001 family)